MKFGAIVYPPCYDHNGHELTKASAGLIARVDKLSHDGGIATPRHLLACQFYLQNEKRVDMGG